MTMALCIIPTYISGAEDLEVVRTCLETLYKTEPKAKVLVVDDHSPRQDLIDALETLELPFEVHRKDENSGFARTVNIGLGLAAASGRDAILVNADLEFIDPGWIAAMQATKWDDVPASVVGARLIYPNGLLQHAGIYFSLLSRCFNELFKYAPYDLPEAMQPRVVPVTGALQFIRHDCLDTVGLYDEGFRMGWEDVDYCIRVWQAGRLSVYNPHVRAYHHESLFRGRSSEKLQTWQNESWLHFLKKYEKTSFAEFVPSVI